MLTKLEREHIYMFMAILKVCRESSVTRRLSKILKWLLFFLSFIRRLKNFLSSNFAAME